MVVIVVNVVMLSVVEKSALMLSAIIRSVVMLSVIVLRGVKFKHGKLTEVEGLVKLALFTFLQNKLP
jgi:hypothetical protein